MNISSAEYRKHSDIVNNIKFYNDKFVTTCKLKPYTDMSEKEKTCFLKQIQDKGWYKWIGLTKEELTASGKRDDVLQLISAILFLTKQAGFYNAVHEGIKKAHCNSKNNTKSDFKIATEASNQHMVVLIQQCKQDMINQLLNLCCEIRQPKPPAYKY